jgi:alpha-ketoglutaric semialdehyde dehydrogenase
MASSWQNYIGGEWVGARSGRTLDNTNPARTSEVLGQLCRSGAEDARDAVKAASEAFAAWRAMPAPKRGDVVLRAWRLMEERAEHIAELLSKEEGKVIKEARGEIQKTLNILEYLGGEGRRFSGVSKPSELPRNFAFTRREPLGVCALITPWNFPVSLPAWKIAPAIVAGNTVVLKPSELTPATACEVVRCYVDAGAPPGVVNLVHGLGGEVGAPLVSAPEVKGISFTGSNLVGQHLYVEGAKRGIPVQCEMGGKNPVIVMNDADVDLAATGAATGAFGSTGQRCTATSRAIVHESVADEFVAAVRQKALGFVPGEAFDPKATMGPLVSQEQLDKVLSYLDVGRSEAKLVCGGHRVTEGGLGEGYFVAPTLFDHVSPDARIAKEEIFGPVLSVVRVRSFDEAMEVANSVAYGLSSSLYTNNYALVFEYADRAETGICHVNSPTIGGEAHFPFGGMKATGIGGREMNEEALEFFTEIKTIYFDYTGARRESNIY